MRLKYGIFVMAILIFLAGCNNNESDHQMSVPEDAAIESGLEEVDETSASENETLAGENETSVSENEKSENETDVPLVYVENYLEEKGEIVDFLKEYFMISSKEDLEVLTRLPLSESFFDSCLDDFDYFDGAIVFVEVEAWMKTEENMYECLVGVYDNDHDARWSNAYSVKIVLAGDQIDQVLIEPIGEDS